MVTVALPFPLPRVALVLALAVLAGSLAAFAGATGLAPATGGDAHEFAIEDGRLVETGGGTNRTLLTDVERVDRIEITDLDSEPVVTASPRRPVELRLPKRKRAKQIVATEAAITDAFDAPDDAVYTIRPIPRSAGSERAAIVGVDPETTWDRSPSAGGADFVVREKTPADTVVLERTERRTSDRRALVVVDPIQRDVRYSLVVDIQNETVDAFVRLRGVSE
jgi:hypothetical protein